MLKINDIPLANRVGFTFSTAFATFLSNLLLFLGCSVALHVLYVLLFRYQSVLGKSESPFVSLAAALFILAVFVVVTAITGGIYVAASARSRTGEPTTFEVAYGIAMARLRPLVGITVLWYFLWALVVMFASAVTMVLFGKDGFDGSYGYILVVLTALLRIFTAFISAAVVIEGRDVLGAFTRSVELVKKDPAMVAVVIVIVEAANHLVAALLPTDLLLSAVAVGIFVVPFEAIAEVLMYLYIRTRGEGRELDEVVGEMGMAVKDGPGGPSRPGGTLH